MTEYAREVAAMQPWGLTIDKFLDHAARWHGSTEIVSRDAEGRVHRSNWSRLREEAAKLTRALTARGIRAGDRVGTLAMNGDRHLAAWFGIMGMGAICHTLNPRLSDDQLGYIIDHAGDRLILSDAEFRPLLERLGADRPALKDIVYLDDPGWATLMQGESIDVAWGRFDEWSPAGLCYTSGTTGRPKGVLYTHRSNYLHTLMIIQPDVFAIGARDTVLPVVPMYHANAWGLTFAVAAVGAKLVLPGMRVDPASLHALIEGEGVSMTAGVPTVWQALLPWMNERGLTFTTLRRVMVGGAACPESLIRDFARHGVEVQHNWGMTETSPLGTSGTPLRDAERQSLDDQMTWRLKQGHVPAGVDMRIVDEHGSELPRDGRHVGRLEVRGHSIVQRYYGEANDAVDADGFFDTGDVGTIDGNGLLAITDRAKDVIKSGGEWISSVELENAAVGHPDVALAAAIGVPHPRWGERPILLIQLRTGAEPKGSEIRALLQARMARWALPDAILFVDSLPVGATGKLDKLQLRAAYAKTWRWPEGDAGADAAGMASP